jgi:signal transduction histidine kinase
VLTSEVEKARSEGDTAGVTVKSDLYSGLAVVATDLLSSVFQNLLNNAVSHNEKPEPEVTIAVEDSNETVSVAIADNCPKIPDSQKDDTFGGGEMGLESSGSGIGLYLVDTLVETYNGSVVVEDNSPEGSGFTFTVRRPR